MLFAELNTEWILSIIVSVFGGSGAATLLTVWWFKVKEQRRLARSADLKLERDARREELDIDSEERKREADLEDNRRQREIDDLREDNTALRKTLTTLQDGVSKRIIAAHESHHECERKYAALEVEFRHLQNIVRELEARIKSYEGRT